MLPPDSGGNIAVRCSDLLPGEMVYALGDLWRRGCLAASLQGRDKEVKETGVLEHGGVGAHPRQTLCPAPRDKGSEGNK
jgi:hypothetical protein